ncbi:patatin-like phospholipase family protein [Dankookia sp. P2]|uniref:patatin-like phospholipase family protein n=1 Tax=Dankookia sp. P2 TaxID=3423955 RepID=UPI003D67D144
MPLGILHVMASGALPPAFPAVRIDGELWWDGGILSNTPVGMRLRRQPAAGSAGLPPCISGTRRGRARNHRAGAASAEGLTATCQPGRQPHQAPAGRCTGCGT